MNAKIRTIGLLVALLGLMVARESWGRAEPRSGAAAEPSVAEERPVSSTLRAYQTAVDEIRAPVAEPPYAGERPDSPGGMGAVRSRRVKERASGMGIGSEPSYRQRIDHLKSVLSGAETADERVKAKETIEALLNKFFDEDIETRQAKIAEIEQRVAKLKEQLQKRLTAKSELIQLQMKLIENEAAGLGFFGAPKANDRGMGMLGGEEMEGYNTYSRPRYKNPRNRNDPLTQP